MTLSGGTKRSLVVALRGEVEADEIEAGLGLQVSTSVLDNDQIIAACTTPHELIAAPESGTLLLPIAVALRANIVTPLTNVNADCDIDLTLGTASDEAFDVVMQVHKEEAVLNLFYGAALELDPDHPPLDILMWAGLPNASTRFHSLLTRGVGLYLQFKNPYFEASTPFEDGGPGNSLTVKTLYAPLSLT